MEFSESQKLSIASYKYSGTDSSLLYKHVLSPLAQNCVDMFVPSWVAPNVITALGLFFSVASCLITLAFDPTLEGKAPRWVYFSTAASILLYQTLDNMDGKQARKTGTSSPLGMYFDHVCDAINAVVTSISMGSVLAVGWSPKLFFFLLTGFVPFYVQTWEEYYTGSLVLPVFNGPNEGLLLISIFAVLSGTFGGNWFQQVRFTKSVLYIKCFLTQACRFSFFSQETDLFHNDLTFLVAGRKLCPFDFVFVTGYLMAFFTLFGHCIKC